VSIASRPAHLARRGARGVGARLATLRFSRQLDVQPRDDLVHLGSEYGGYVVPMGLLGPDATCYSCGVGEDVSFDLELIAATGCRVRAFDPTPRAEEFARSVAMREPRFSFFPYGIWKADETMRFFSPEDETHVSHSIDNLQQTRDYFEAECRSVTSIMAELGDDRIDLLKLDVEGAEYEILQSIIDTDVDIRTVCAEFHKVTTVGDMIAAVRRFVAAGFVPVHADGFTATFVRTGGPATA
jgi:FkbM family methyltransferase